MFEEDLTLPEVVLMCFRINYKRSAESYPRRTAYKVVYLNSDSFVVSCTNHTHYWGPGYVYRSNGPTRIECYNYDLARSGIYVYETEAAAKRNCIHSEHVVLQVEVEASDCIWRGRIDRSFIATFEKVYVPDIQPYIEWEK